MTNLPLSMMSTNHLPALALAAFAVLSSCGPKNEFVEPAPPKVTVQEPEVVESLTVYDEFTGRTSPVQDVEIRARVKGFLDEIKFKPSQRVKGGDVLFMIEQDPFQAAVNSAQGQLESAEATRDLKTAEYKRKEQAFQTKAVSELDMLTSKADMDAAIASVSIAKANLEQANIDLDYTVIKSPIEGRVSKERVTIGNLVGGGDATLLTTVVDDSSIYANFEMSEREVLQYLPRRAVLEDPNSEEGKGERTTVNLRLTNNEVYSEPGRIDFADNRIDPDTGTIQLRAVFPNKDSVLAAGLFANVMIPTTLENALVVPTRAIQRDLGGEFVLIVGEGDLVTVRRVKAGRLLGEKRVIDEGLKPGERVIVSGLQVARAGAKVTPMTGEAVAGEAPAPAPEGGAAPAGEAPTPAEEGGGSE